MSPSITRLHIEEVVEADIRPVLKIHGGGVNILDVDEEGRVHLEFEGACRGCALQSVTYAVGIRQRLLEVPGVSDVTMRGIKVSPIALKRIANLYAGYPFRIGRSAERNEQRAP
jgi:Fe-S cluster biogenesis protein NfuA